MRRRLGFPVLALQRAVAWAGLGQAIANERPCAKIAARAAGPLSRAALKSAGVRPRLRKRPRDAHRHRHPWRAPRARRGAPRVLGGPRGLARHGDPLPGERTHAPGARPARPRALAPGRDHAASRRPARRDRAGGRGRAPGRACRERRGARRGRGAQGARELLLRLLHRGAAARPSGRSTSPTASATWRCGSSRAGPRAWCSATSACASGRSASTRCLRSASSRATAGRRRSRATTSAACCSPRATSRVPSTSSSWAWRSRASSHRSTGSRSASSTRPARTCGCSRDAPPTRSPTPTERSPS